MAISKSCGVTDTEKLLASFCDRSFLKLWSYPNPINEERKELCDILAVFENHVFIFFDRNNLQLEDASKDIILNWKRWKRKVIDSQVRTANGVERYIRNNRKIFLDVELTVPLPIKIDVNSVVIHKIIVAHGAQEACLRHSDENTSGSLGIIYSDNSKDSIDNPFMVNINKNDPVHIFDSHNLPIIFDELNTLYDFKSYLEAKLDAINFFDVLVYCGEEDLLANYFLNYDEEAKKHYIAKKQDGINGLLVEEGAWKDFICRDVYKAKKTADEESYFWDELIQMTCSNALGGTVLGNANIFNGPNAIYEMAKEPRFMRRELSKAMIDAINKFPEAPGNMRHVLFMPSFYKGKGYVFLQLKIDKITDYENDYRPRRRKLLDIACGAAKNKFKEFHTIVGIAIDAPKFSKRNSEDFIFMDCSKWSDKEKAYYEDENQRLNFFQSSSLKSEIRKAVEFPEII